MSAVSQSSSDLQQNAKEPQRYLSKVEAVAMASELLGEYRYGQQQLVEMWGHACAIAVTKVFPLVSLQRSQPTALVMCGPGLNGCVGLACARHLHTFDYTPTVFCPTRSPLPLQRDLRVQCERSDVPFLAFLPSEVQLINQAYNFVVDAIFGPETDPSSMGGLYHGVLLSLKRISIPIASLDVPSGWEEAEPGADRFSPAVLISLMAPKKCAAGFRGTHYLVGHTLPYDLQRKYELRPPEPHGADGLVQLE